MSSVEIVPSAPALLSLEARTYAVRQLARRAGVPESWFSQWHIQHGAQETTVRPGCGSQVLRFPYAAGDYWEQVSRGNFLVTRANWPEKAPAELQRITPDFVIPFCDRNEPVPLFALDQQQATCQVDLLTAMVLTLSRYEETLPGDRDRHGRFPDKAGLAVKHGFATRPIVDEYGVGLQYVLQRLFPAWKPEVRRLQVNLTHDVDEIGIPFKPRLAARRTVRGGVVVGLKEIAGVFGSRPTALHAVLTTAQQAQARGIRSAIYWKASPLSSFDSGYALADRRVEAVIAELAKSGCELGVHPGYFTFLNREVLANEVSQLRAAFGNDAPLGGRQHFLRWSQQTWKDWEACGLAYDGSVGYSECVGFRAGTCYPYRPWLLEEDREADLLEVPLIAMDCTLTGPMRLRSHECLETLRQCQAACRSVGGVFTLLWHTDSILEPVYGNCYQRMLDDLAGTSQFDWRHTISTNYA